MSIWCSTDHIGTDPTVMYDMGGGMYEVDLGDGARDGRQPVQQVPQHGEVRAYAEGFSNHYPTTDGDHEVPAAVALATVAPWCVPGHDDCGDCDDHTGGWLRLEVAARGARDWWCKDEQGVPAREDVGAAVVLDVAAARELGRRLTEWADSEHVTPRTEEDA